MLFLILALAILLVLAVFFHNDHDRSYDKRGDAAHTYHPEVQAPARSRPTPKPAVEQTLSWTYLYALEYDGRLVADTMDAEVTGMRYYCKPSEIGPVNGIIQPEPANPHDHRAQAVIRADGKKIGYLPRYALDEYESFNKGNLICPFAGRVTVDGKGYMQGVIRIALPLSREFAKKELSGFLESQP